MVVEASPTSSLEVPEPELLFEFLVIPLDAPAQLRERDEAVEGDVFRNGRKPELRGFLLLSWPFDQEPFLIPGNASIEVPEHGHARSERSGRRHFPRARRSSPRPRPEAKARDPRRTGAGGRGRGPCGSSGAPAGPRAPPPAAGWR